jgi:hypothetical protein
VLLRIDETPDSVAIDSKNRRLYRHRLDLRSVCPQRTGVNIFAVGATLYLILQGDVAGEMRRGSDLFPVRLGMCCSSNTRSTREDQSKFIANLLLSPLEMQFLPNSEFARQTSPPVHPPVGGHRIR